MVLLLLFISWPELKSKLGQDRLVSLVDKGYDCADCFNCRPRVGDSAMINFFNLNIFFPRLLN